MIIRYLGPWGTLDPIVKIKVPKPKPFSHNLYGTLSRSPIRPIRATLT